MLIESIYILAMVILMTVGTVVIVSLWLWWKDRLMGLVHEFGEVMDRAWYWVVDKVMGEHTKNELHRCVDCRYFHSMVTTYPCNECKWLCLDDSTGLKDNWEHTDEPIS